MELRFVKMNPTRNMTILVETPVPRTRHGEIAKQLMAQDSVGAEQVGYIEQATNSAATARLQMMGGEFCGNASMSLAALLAMRDGLEDKAERGYTLEVSGANDLVRCNVTRDKDSYIGEVDMPLPDEIGVATPDVSHRYPVARFPGITHLIVPENDLTRESAEKFAPIWCENLNADALGLLLTDNDLTHMRPLVYVRGSGSSVWECGCGSGTAALGAYRAYSATRDTHMDVSQPGGVIRVLARVENGRVTALRIRGRVLPVCAGTAWVDAE